MAASYSHIYFDADDLPLGILSEFPSDDDIAAAASAAFDKADALWDLLGYYNTSNLDNIACVPQPPEQEEEEGTDNTDNADDSAFHDCNGHLLWNALDSSRKLPRLDSDAQGRLDECIYAAACLDIADQEIM